MFASMYECCVLPRVVACLDAVLHPLVQARPDVAVPGFKQVPIRHAHRFQSHAWRFDIDRNTGTDGMSVGCTAHKQASRSPASFNHVAEHTPACFRSTSWSAGSDAHELNATVCTSITPPCSILLFDFVNHFATAPAQFQKHPRWIAGSAHLLHSTWFATP